MTEIRTIIDRAKAYLPGLDDNRFMRAFYFAEEAHQGQTRFSGEPYIIHPLSVTEILLDFHPDENSLIAAMLHDVSEDTDKTLDEIETAFGKDVRILCWGMQKLSKVRSKLNDPQVDNLRKLFLAMAQDFRVVLIKLCDRLHNMRTLDFVRDEKRKRIAQETLYIYAPIAARLGIYRLKSELEDLCFKHLNQKEYDSIQKHLIRTGKWREKYIETAKKILIETLSREGIQTSVDGRIKSVYSIYRKLQKKNKTSLEDIFDIFAMRIILPNIYKYGKEYTGHVYNTLGVLHSNFTPLAHRFKDYVAVPKVNGYRSLHTTVMGLGPKIYTQPTEIQIRTDSMHNGAEFGIAAHWLYEESALTYGQKESRICGTKGVSESILAAYAAAPYAKQQKEWIAALHRIQKETQNNQELLESLKVDTFQDRIFVLTPRGDVHDLPLGATPVDFAYAVHTEIGNHCIGARVNGNIVPVDCELKSGEVVHILTRKNAHPNQHWLAFVKTNHARNRIRGWFRNLDDDKHLREGKRLLDEKLKQFGQLPLDENISRLKTCEGKNLTMRERQQLLIEIGTGALQPGVLIKKIFTIEQLLSMRPKKTPVSLARPVDKSAYIKNKIPLSIGGEENIPYHFVKCCSASAADDLVGYVTRGQGVSVHKKTCSTIRNSEPHRLIVVRTSGSKQHYRVHIAVFADNRKGLVHDISHCIAENDVNIFDLYQNSPKNGHTELHFILEIENFDQFERILGTLEKIPSVRRAMRIN